MSRRGWVPWIALGAVVVGLVVWAAWPSGSRTDADRVADLSRQIRCPDCESLSVADSHTSSARAIRRDLRERVAEGQSDATIRRAYEERYGESIVLEPERSGFGLVVWGLPVLFLGAGAAGLVVAFRRWRRATPLRPTDADEALVLDARRERTR